MTNPNHYGQHKNIPIVRVGNIAAMPEERVATQMGLIDAYLVEARSIGGLSGSPVFVSLSLFRRNSNNYIGPTNRQKVHYLIGLMHGHYGTRLPDYDMPAVDASDIERVNVGIAIVVPSQKIMEVITQPLIQTEEDRIAVDLRRKQLPRPDVPGTEIIPDASVDSNVNDGLL